MFDFLGIPREIRDEIYELCLVRETIEFEEFYVDETPEDWMQDRKLEALTLHVAKPDETPLLVYQGIPFVHRVESLTPIDGRSRWDDIFYEGRERSYRLHRATADPPFLNIFLTSRLIYQESSMMFYAKNYFCFPSRDCELTLNACSGFLTDRPEQALTYISNISLEIGLIDRKRRELERPPYGIRVHWPTMQRLSDVLRGTLDPKGPSKLKFLFEEQCPSDRALAHRLEGKGYDYFPERMLDIPTRKSLKNLNELQINLVENSYGFMSDFKVEWMARFVLDHWSVARSKVSRSIVNVGSKRMFHTRLTWSQSENGMSRLARLYDA